MPGMEIASKRRKNGRVMQVLCLVRKLHELKAHLQKPHQK